MSEECPACGDESCNKELAWVDDVQIHVEEHPENRAERGRETRNRR